MESASIRAAILESHNATISAEYSAKVMRKSLDIVAQQGAMLAQMVDQGTGVGRTLDITT